MIDENKNIQELLIMLRSDNARTRIEACVLLGASQVRSKEVVVALVNALDDSDASVVEAAKNALAIKPSTVPSQGTLPIKSSTTPSQIPMGNIQKWEHRWEFVFLDDGEYVLLVGKNRLSGRGVWDHLASLGRNGWELVSVAPQIGDTNPAKRDKAAAFMNMFDMAMAGPRITPLTQHKTGTTGYFFWYKRPLATIQCPTCKAV
jgi:hypothetical protein